MNRYSLKDHKWARVQDVLIDGEDKRNAYWQLYVDEKGTIHLSWVWRETWQVETNHDLCYARSFDNGVTWYKSDGEQYKLILPLIGGVRTVKSLNIALSGMTGRHGIIVR